MTAEPAEGLPPQSVSAGRSRPGWTLRDQALAVPNLVTYARIAAVPLVMTVMAADSPTNALIAAAIFAAASATDALDGYLARRLNQVSIIGKFLDPLADKLIVLGALVMLLQLGRVSPWVVFLLVSREIIVTTLRTIAISEGVVIAARSLGKWKTGFQMVGLACLLIHYPYAVPAPGLGGSVSFHALGTALIWVSVVFSLLSAADYFWGFFRSLQAREAAEQGL